MLLGIGAGQTSRTSGVDIAIKKLVNDIRVLNLQIFHKIAMKPEALSIDGLSYARLNSERFMIEEQVNSLSKPEEITEKIVDGLMAKYYEKVILLEQKFIKDDKMKVSDFIKLSELNVFSSISAQNIRNITT
ncbi:Elongation factor Ts [Dirofilaria immitis]|nr:Elongation factor Ts [Dirofilaria immitis]